MRMFTAFFFFKRQKSERMNDLQLRKNYDAVTLWAIEKQLETMSKTYAICLGVIMTTSR